MASDRKHPVTGRFLSTPPPAHDALGIISGRDRQRRHLARPSRRPACSFPRRGVRPRAALPLPPGRYPRPVRRQCDRHPHARSGGRDAVGRRQLRDDTKALWTDSGDDDGRWVGDLLVAHHLQPHRDSRHHLSAAPHAGRALALARTGFSPSHPRDAFRLIWGTGFLYLHIRPRPARAGAGLADLRGALPANKAESTLESLARRGADCNGGRGSSRPLSPGAPRVSGTHPAVARPADGAAPGRSPARGTRNSGYAGHVQLQWRGPLDVWHSRSPDPGSTERAVVLPGTDPVRSTDATARLWPRGAVAPRHPDAEHDHTRRPQQHPRHRRAPGGLWNDRHRGGVVVDAGDAPGPPDAGVLSRRLEPGGRGPHGLDVQRWLSRVGHSPRGLLALQGPFCRHRLLPR